LAVELLSGGKECNIFQSFSFQLAKTWIKNIQSEKGKTTNQELISTVLDSPDMLFILARMGVNKKAVLDYVLTKKEIDVNKLMTRTLEIAKAESHHQIEIGDLFVALCEADAGLAKFISDLKLDIADIANIVYWQTNVVRAQRKAKSRLFDPDDLALTGGIGRDWAFGNTLYLKQFSYDLTDMAAHHALNLEIIGHDKEIKQLEEALTRGKGGNAILVGDPGVGKKTTILGFAKKVYKGEVANSLKNKHLFQVDIEALLAGAAGGGEIVQKINGILNEAAQAGNTILFFENIQNLFSSGDAGKVNAAEAILPFLETPDLYIVGSCDIGSYSRYIENNSALVQRFAKINIEEPSREEMIRILEDVVPTIEHHTASLVAYSAIKETIKLADKYVLNIPNPEKSINLLDGGAAKASADRGQTIILPQDLDIYVSEKYEVPTGDVEEAEKKKLLALEETMHKRVIGQEEAVNAIANAMRRSRAQMTETKKPIGSFLFLGTTGVGKTETAKALAEAYFGSEEKMVRFDMSEYQNKQDIYRLIGSNEGGEELPGVLTSEIREHSFTLVLLDEIEKAHPDILNLFLQVLDEGHLTDGAGRMVSFSNTIIIATSNAGANMIRESIQNGVQYEQIKKGLINQLQSEGIYKPEFLNRFTAVVIFSPLTLEQISQIAGIMIAKLKADLAQNKGVDIEVAPDALRMLAQMGFDPVMGARPMQRTISEKLENMLAKRLLSGNLKKGDKITIMAQDIEP
jgi:ATP-dependent Clp protease ATP-binding subunit ClpC